MVGSAATILCGLVISPVLLSWGTLKSTLTNNYQVDLDKKFRITTVLERVSTLRPHHILIVFYSNPFYKQISEIT
jgi:hypothetical protein